MIRVDDARVINREYDFALRETAGGEDPDAMYSRLRYDYIRHDFRMPNAHVQRMRAKRLTLDEKLAARTPLQLFVRRLSMCSSSNHSFCNALALVLP